MFPSDTYNSANESSLESLLLKKPSFSFHHHLHLSSDHQNPITSKQEDDPHPPFFSHFPSPFFDEHELPLNLILPHPVTAPEKAADRTHHNGSGSVSKNDSARLSLKPEPQKLKQKADDDRHHPSSKRRKTGKKDRHSKICTARGIRDRRMRLSLQIARKFFDLQDMLGYDKASNTIEWLFSKSKRAIRDLMTTKEKNSPQGHNDNINNNNFNYSVSDAKSESFLSECEVVSGVVLDVSSKELGQIAPKNEKRKPRKVMRRPKDLRELREKARARARWRTREKMMIRANFSVPNCQNHHDFQKLGFSNCSIGGAIDQDVGTIEKLLGSSSLSTSNACPISENYCTDHHPSASSFVGFIGNWDILSNVDRLNHCTQFTVTNPNSVHCPAPNFPLFHQ